MLTADRVLVLVLKTCSGVTCTTVETLASLV